MGTAGNSQDIPASCEMKDAPAFAVLAPFVSGIYGNNTEAVQVSPHGNDNS